MYYLVCLDFVIIIIPSHIPTRFHVLMPILTILTIVTIFKETMIVRKDIGKILTVLTILKEIMHVLAEIEKILTILAILTIFEDNTMQRMCRECAILF